MKFGGSSVADAEKISKAADRVIARKLGGADVVVVVSAMGDSTDHLIELARSVTDDPPDREMDMLMSSGERVSMALLSMAIQGKGHAAISLTGSQAEIITDTSHRRARITDIRATRVREEIKKGKIVIVAGFQGVSSAHEVTTLGRGGSDTTAVALAYALKADVCEILTDVPGVFTADPRIVPNARKLEEICFEEMLELASMGAKVLQSRSVEMASKYGVVLRVGPAHMEEPGTIIKEEDSTMEQVLVRGIALNMDEVKFTVHRVPDRPGVAAAIFSKLAERGVNVDMIIQNIGTEGYANLSFTISTGDIEKTSSLTDMLKNEIGAEDVSFNDNIAKVSIVGVGMRSHTGVAEKVFRALADLGVNIEMISTSEIKISVIIAKDRAEEATRALHDAFVLEMDAAHA
ncbi:MAG: aspartate kinase [Candidatus Latescibacteria bacterium]|nr:aspartate kinase [Candidatus Latescibacterota bacterium]